ncbi:MAG: NAD(P)-dependent oxidoreductase [Sphingobacterium sp.]
MSNILLTGQNGFIGSNLYDYFAQHNKVSVLKSRISVASKLYDYFPIDTIIHCAHEGSDKDSGTKPNLLMFNNLMMLYKLLEVRDCKRIFYFGSGSEFDKRNHIKSVTEDETGKSIPEDKMGFVKYVMNMVARESNNIYNLRLFGIFGENDFRVLHRRVIYNLCIKAINRMDLVVKDNHKYDFLYVKDLIKIVDKFVNKEEELKYHDYNICTGKVIDFIEIASIVRKISGHASLNIKIENDKGMHYCGNNERMISEIGSIEFTPIEESIESVYKWIYDNKLYVM